MELTHSNREITQDSELIDRLNAELRDAQAVRDEWKNDWTDITDYVLPRRAGYDFATGAKSADQTAYRDKRTDSTATEACTKLSDGLMGYTVSPAYPWFKLSFMDKELNDYSEARDWLDEVEEKLYAAFKQSNFYSAMPDVFADGCSIGTATLYCDEALGTGKVQFIAVHPFEVFIDEDVDGRVIQVFRIFHQTQQQLKDAFGEEAAEFAQLGANQKHQVVQCVELNKGAVPSRFPWQSTYWHKSSGKILELKGYYENPYIVWRYRKNTGEKYGRSPAYDTLPDIMTLQKVTRSLAKGVQLAVEPPINAPAKMRGKIKLIPNGVNYYADPSEVVSPVQYGSNFNLGYQYHQQLRDNVLRAFRADIFLSLEAATRQMTAEEVMQRQGEKAAILGAIVGRMGSELLNPIIQRVFGLEYRAGSLPELPEGVEGGTLEIDFDGPLYQAQKRYHQAGSLQTALAQILPLTQLYPDTMKILDMDGIIRRLIEASGMPGDTFRDEREVALLQKQEAAQQAQLMQMQLQAQQQQLQNETYQAMSKPTDPTSPMAALAQGANRAAGGIV